MKALQAIGPAHIIGCPTKVAGYRGQRAHLAAQALHCWKARFATPASSDCSESSRTAPSALFSTHGSGLKAVS